MRICKIKYKKISEKEKGVGLSIICYTIGIKICEVFIGREPT